VKRLRLDYFGPSANASIYALVDKLGPEVTQLELQIRREVHSDPLDISKVLAACPRIKKFTTSLVFAASSVRLKPQHFKYYDE